MAVTDPRTLTVESTRYPRQSSLAIPLSQTSPPEDNHLRDRNHGTQPAAHLAAKVSSSNKTGDGSSGGGVVGLAPEARFFLAQHYSNTSPLFTPACSVTYRQTRR